MQRFGEKLVRHGESINTASRTKVTEVERLHYEACGILVRRAGQEISTWGGHADRDRHEYAAKIVVAAFEQAGRVPVYSRTKLTLQHSSRTVTSSLASSSRLDIAFSVQSRRLALSCKLTTRQRCTWPSFSNSSPQ